jgi:hypothetical protein
VGSVRQDCRGVFGVRFVDEQMSAARQVERVGAAGVIGCEH